MKKIILLLLLINCGTRNTQANVDKEKKIETITVSAVEKSIEKTDLTKSVKSEIANQISTREEKHEATKTTDSKENVLQKSAAETSGKSLKKKTYFENGTLKSETDYTESFSKIENENETLRSKISTQSEAITHLKSANSSLQKITHTQKITIAAERAKNQKNETEKTETAKLKTKQSESKRSSFAWHVLSAFLGIAIYIKMKFLWNKYGGKLINKLTTNQ